MQTVIRVSSFVLAPVFYREYAHLARTLSVGSVRRESSRPGRETRGRRP